LDTLYLVLRFILNKETADIHLDALLVVPPEETRVWQLIVHVNSEATPRDNFAMERDLIRLCRSEIMDNESTIPGIKEGPMILVKKGVQAGRQKDATRRREGIADTIA